MPSSGVLSTCIPCRLHHASVYDILFGSTRCALRQRRGHASFIGINQGCLGCSASTPPVLVSLSSLIRWVLKTMAMPTTFWWAAFACRGLPRGKTDCRWKSQLQGEISCRGNTNFLAHAVAAPTGQSSGKGRQHRAKRQSRSHKGTEVLPSKISFTALAYREAPAGLIMIHNRPAENKAALLQEAYVTAQQMKSALPGQHQA